MLDLTNNGGGMADTALYTLSWLLGSTRMTLLDTANGTESTVAYSFDGNRNCEFNEPDDYIGTTNYKICCLISPLVCHDDRMDVWVYRGCRGDRMDVLDIFRMLFR